MSWKSEREPKVKHCMGRQIDVVQKFTRIRSGANGIRVEHLHKIHHIAALPQSPRATVKIERNTRETYWTDLHVDVQRHLMGINAQLVSLYAKRFEKDNGHFLGPGSEKK